MSTCAKEDDVLTDAHLQFLRTMCGHLSAILRRMTDEITAYTSYLVRVWQQSRPDQPGAAIWRAEAEHIQTGQRRRFDDPQALLAFLQQQNQPGEHDEPQTHDV